MFIHNINIKKGWMGDDRLNVGDILLLGMINGQINYNFSAKRTARIFKTNEELIRNKTQKLIDLGLVVVFKSDKKDILVVTNQEENIKVHTINEFTFEEERINIKQQKERNTK